VEFGGIQLAYQKHPLWHRGWHTISFVKKQHIVGLTATEESQGIPELIKSVNKQRACNWQGTYVANGSIPGPRKSRKWVKINVVYPLTDQVDTKLHVCA
jgi:hypothetical protein